MKLILCFLAVLCSCVSKANQNPGVPALNIGDQVPNVIFNEVVNYKKTTASLQHFKNKLILVDFLTTTCSPCIKEISILDSLQKINPGLSVLLVSSSRRDTKEKVFNVLARIKKNTGSSISLPAMLGDTIMNQLFPHSSVPHFAWLDSNLKVIAISSVQEASPERIVSMIKDIPIQFLKREDQKDFRKDLPLFVNGNGGSGSCLIAQSVISSYVTGLPSGFFFSKDSSRQVTQVLASNVYILALLKRAYSYFDNPARIVWPEGRESLLNPANKSSEWQLKNRFAYSLTLPTASYEKAMTAMQEDIKRYFGYTAVIKKTNSACYVLTVDSSTLSKQLSPGGKRLNNLPDQEMRSLQNCPVSDVAEFLNFNLELPVVDESIFTGNIDLNLMGIDLSNIAAVKKYLLAFGIHLQIAERPINHFFIYYQP